MMNLKMEVYSPSLTLLGLLEIHRSIIWEEKAFGAGSFSLESLLTKETRKLLSPENIIWIEGDTAGIIEYYDKEAKDGTYITVKGPLLTGILDRRILWGRYSLTGTPPEIMHQLVSDCAVNTTRGDVAARKIPGLVLLDPPTGGESIRAQKTGGSLLEALEELGKTYGVAFGVRFNAAVPQMEFWTRWGQNRTIHQTINEPVFYSTELDDVLESEYTYNSGDYRNVALIAGEGEGDNRTMVVVENEDETYIPDIEPPAPTKEKYTIALAVDPSGGGVATGGGTIQSGNRVTVTAAPSTNYGFVGWRESGQIVSTDTAYTFIVNRSRNLTAVFVSTIVYYIVTVNTDPAGGGTVSGGGSVEQGQSVTLTQTTADGYRFSGWYIGGTLLSADSTYTFTPTGNVTITAKYAAIPVYTITATIDPAGTGTVTGAGQYQEGEQATITATPADGYTFSGWQEGGVTVSESESYTFTVTGNRTFVAAFEEAPARQKWVKTTLPVSAAWVSIAYGNDKFVAIAKSNNKIAYSTDGINWTEVNTGTYGIWNCVTYGNGKFVAVGQQSSIAIYSEDGITWNRSTLPSSAYWYTVAYGNGKFVALNNTNKGAYSTDGINWKDNTLPATTTWKGLTYGGDKFVALSSANTNVAAYSFDGISWKQTTLPASAYWINPVYGNGKFVAASSSNGNKSIYSEDGINWNLSKLPSNAYWSSIAFGDGKFIVVSANDSNKFAYGEDGANWMESTMPSSSNWKSIAYGNGRFVATTETNLAAYTV